MKHAKNPTPEFFVHVSKYGTYHPAPGADVAWTINDTRGYTDGGPSCDSCGACDCDDVYDGFAPEDHTENCIGLSFAYVCLDGGDSLCEDCAAGHVEIIPCDCK